MRYQVAVRGFVRQLGGVRAVEVFRVSLWLVRSPGSRSREWIGEEPVHPKREPARERCRIAKKLLSSERARIEKKQIELAKRLTALAKLEQELKK